MTRVWFEEAINYKLSDCDSDKVFTLYLLTTKSDFLTVKIELRGNLTKYFVHQGWVFLCPPSVCVCSCSAPWCAAVSCPLALSVFCPRALPSCRSSNGVQIVPCSHPSQQPDEKVSRDQVCAADADGKTCLLSLWLHILRGVSSTSTSVVSMQTEHIKTDSDQRSITHSIIS